MQINPAGLETIKREYETACTVVSDIKDHMPLLYSLASECDCIVEGGVRYVVSSWAFILGCACKGGRVDSYCWNMLPEIQRAIDICETAGVWWCFHECDWLTQSIPENDLLFIDTNHFYWQLKDELRTHGPKASKYIVLHDTVTFGQTGADRKQPGLWQAVQEFTAAGDWRIKEHYTYCNGLTILEKVHGNS